MSELQLDRAGRRRSPAAMPGFHAGRAPRNKGLRYPADPPKVEEIVAVMHAAGDGAHGRRLRGMKAVHRHDLAVLRATTRRSSDSVAPAMRESGHSDETIGPPSSAAPSRQKGRSASRQRIGGREGTRERD